MSDPTLSVLVYTAISVAFLHTLVGVDHTLPFVVLGRARKWSLKKTLTITALCGVGHVTASIALGGIGIAAGIALSDLEVIEGVRGSWEAWALIGFGLAYATWSIVRNARGKRHAHPHAHGDGTIHNHDHEHQREHLHVHAGAAKAGARKGNMLTAWALFIVFALGPCEALIPLFMVPAADMGMAEVVLIAAVFSAVTIGTMLAIVTVGYLGLRMSVVERIEHHAHTLAGLAIAVSGAIIGLI